MRKLIFVLLILSFIIGTLSAFEHSSLFRSGNQNPQMSRDRSWKIAELLREEWQVSTWSQRERDVFYYNPVYGNVDSLQAFLLGEDGWELAAAVTMTYTPGREYISRAEYVFIMGGERLNWINKYATYDEQNRLTSYRLSRYDDETELWNDEMREFFTYNTDGTFQVSQWQAGEDETPDEYSRLSYIADAQGRMLAGTWQDSADSINWVNHDHQDYTYHLHDTLTGAQIISNFAHQYLISGLQGIDVFLGMITEELHKEWLNNEWINSSKYTNTYNDNDKLAEVLYQDWQSEIWVGDWKENYTYDINNNLQQMTYQEFSIADGWENNERMTYTWSQVTANEDDVLLSVHCQ